MANKDSSQALKCSFCGKSQKQVIKLIAGPGVYICDECIELCVEIIEEEKVEKVAEDTDRDFWMTAQEAKEYGIVDEVLIQRELADKK